MKTHTILATLLEETNGQHFGSFFMRAGDVNGDLVEDFVVCDEGYNGWSGKVYVYSGRDQQLINSYEGEVLNAHFGSKAIPVGDINDDGFGEISFNDYQYNTFSGRVFIRSVL